jgi:hypothetical protein
MTDDSLFLKGYNIKYTFTPIYIILIIYIGVIYFLSTFTIKIITVICHLS